LDGKIVMVVAALDNIGTTTTLASSVTLSSVVTLAAAVGLFLMWVPAHMDDARERRSESGTVPFVRDKSQALPRALWLWFCWVLLSFGWNADIGKLAIQNLCVYASFVFVADLTARHATVEYGKRLLGALTWVVWIISLVYLLSVAKYGLGTTVVLRSRGTAIEDAILAGAVVLAWRGFRIGAARFVPIFLLVTVTLSLSRMSLAICMLAIATAYSVSSGRRKAIMSKRSFRRLVGGVLAAGGAFTYLVFNWAPLRDRFIGGDQAVVGGVQINTSGRIGIWSLLWHNAIPSITHIIIGQGAASSEILLGAQFAVIRGKQVLEPSCDYLRMFYDFGLVGLALFVVGMVQLAIRTYRWAAEEPGRHVATLHWAAFLASAALLGSMITDNPVTYSFCMLPFGALIGISMGLARNRMRRRELLSLQMQLAEVPGEALSPRPRILPSSG